MPIKPHIYAINAILLITLLTACGFKPRGALPTIDHLPMPMLITGISTDHAIYPELQRQLKRAGATLANSKQKAASRLVINQYRSTQRVVSTDSAREATEYELKESFSYKLITKQNLEPTERNAQTTRILQQTSDETNSGNVRRDQLRKQMRRYLVSQMIRSLALSKN